MVCKVKNATRGRRGKIKQEKDESAGRELVSAIEGSSFDEEEDEDMRSYMRDHGTGMLKELIGRMENTMEEAEEYDMFLKVFGYKPSRIEGLRQCRTTWRCHGASQNCFFGDEFDLSQSSLCMVRVFPGYAQNSRKYKIMAKKISLLTLDEISQMYHGYISVNLHGIIRGTQCSRRMNLYEDYTGRTGNDALRRLRDENILKPFTQEQIEHLMNLIASDFPANQSNRALEQADDAPVVDMDLALYLPYYVLLPEALMRIYAMVNQMSLKMAEEVMKWGAARDEKLALKVTLYNSSIPCVAMVNLQSCTRRETKKETDEQGHLKKNLRRGNHRNGNQNQSAHIQRYGSQNQSTSRYQQEHGKQNQRDHDQRHGSQNQRGHNLWAQNECRNVKLCVGTFRNVAVYTTRLTSGRYGDKACRIYNFGELSFSIPPLITRCSSNSPITSTTVPTNDVLTLRGKIFIGYGCLLPETRIFSHFS